MENKIDQYPFNELGIEEIKNISYGINWPVVYILNGEKEAYIGETISAYKRMRQHKANNKRTRLNKVHIVYDSEFNKSATLDIEALLINYMAADQKYKLQNVTSGIGRECNYYDRDKYLAKFDNIWNALIQKGIAKHDRLFLENLNIFKFSPFKKLTEDQYSTAMDIIKMIISNKQKNKKSTFVVSGNPGTGKTVLAAYLMKFLSEFKTNSPNIIFNENHINYTSIINMVSHYQGDMKIALVVPMESLRKTLKGVFKQTDGLRANMVIAPSEVIKKHYDIIIVDEAHRLRRRVNLTPGLYHTFDVVNKKLGLENGDELDWIIRSSDHQIFFYDPNQSVKPSDVRKEDFRKLIDEVDTVQFYLTSQMRVRGGDYYISNIFALLNQTINITSFKLDNYDLKLFNDVNEMINQIKIKDRKEGLCRVVAGYAWPWKTKKYSYDEIYQNNMFDIRIGQYTYLWNHTNKDWVNSLNALNEIGCIHTIQGYDLNYVGVIIGPELKYDKLSNKIYIDSSHYYDINGKKSIKTQKELFDYIINIYKVLLTRGIKGTYIYICDDNLKDYFKQFFTDDILIII